MSAEELLSGNSYAALPAHLGIERLVRFPGRKRTPEFTAAFDTTTLFYDCFWHADGQRILLVGPPLGTIAQQARRIEFIAEPGGPRLSARRYPSLSTEITELRGAPEFTTYIRVRIDDAEEQLRVWPSGVSLLKGKRVLFSINRDNELDWIREWALYHASMHGTDAVILFDNGSSKYTVEELLNTLSEVPGIAYTGVPSWPFKFGFTDTAVRINPYWAHFLQISSMSVTLRRYAGAAKGVLNCDIDELARPLAGTTIYNTTAQTPSGLAVFGGQWIEPQGERAHADHRDFHMRLRNKSRARSRPNKWALDPTRQWVQNLNVHPYWHWIEGRPWFGKARPAGAGYWHFRAINTNWKAERTATRVPDGQLEPDTELMDAFERQQSETAG